MKRIASIPMLTLLVLAASGSSRAQTQRQDTLMYVYPTEVLVTAPRISTPLRELPFSASIVDRAIIRELPRSVAIDEALSLVPGVKVDNQANGSRVHLSIRGQGILTERGIRGIRILYDGIPINDPTGFAPDFFDVDFNGVERIEVLRGEAASLYGGSASGGILNILSRNSLPVPLSGGGQVFYGSNNFWKGFGEVGGAMDDVNYSLSFSRMMGNGYREHTHFRGDNVYGKAIYTPSSFFSITPVLGWVKVYHENPEGITLTQFINDPRQANPDAIPFNEYLETERVTGGMTGTAIITEEHEVQFSGYVKRTLFTEANNRTFNDRTLTTPGASLQYTWTSGRAEDAIRSKLSAGSDLQWQTIDESRVDNLHSVRGDTIRSREQISQRSGGLFLIEKLAIGPRWIFMGSLRRDIIHNDLNDLLRFPLDLSGAADFARTTARIGFTYTASPALNVFANWGEGFLPPATEELAQNPDHFGGFNTHLTSSTSNGLDLGARGGLANILYYDVTGFYLVTENDFDRYRISDPLRSQETFYRNAGSSRRFGIELYSRYLPVEILEVQLAYTYSHFKYANSTPLRVMMDDPAQVKYIVSGNWLPNSPRHQLHVDLQVRPLQDLTVGLSTETLSKTYIDGADIESEAAPGYTLVHARITIALSPGNIQADVSLQGRNLGDRKYVGFTEPDPGGNSYQPGAGREFFAVFRLNL